MPEINHELAMLKLQSENVSAMSSEQLYFEYKKIILELKDATKKYNKENPQDASGTRVGFF